VCHFSINSGKKLSQNPHEMNSLKIALSGITTFLLLAHCSTDVEIQHQLDPESARAIEAVETIENTIGILESIASSAHLQAILTSGRQSSETYDLGCAEAQLTMGSQGGTIVLVYKEEGCPASGGQAITGSLIIDFPYDWTVEGAEITITYNDLMIDDILLEGTQTITMVSTSDTGTVQQIEMEQGTLTWPNGAKSTWSSDRTHTITTDPEAGTFEMLIEGSLNGISAEGLAFETTIDEPIIFKSECATGDQLNVPVSGKKTILLPENQDAPEILVDYGNGACDDQFTVTINDRASHLDSGDIGG
jgi:hypothetical protein